MLNLIRGQHFSVLFSVRDSSDCLTFYGRNVDDEEINQPISCCLGTPLNASACQCLYESKWLLRFYLHNTPQSTNHGCYFPCCLGDDLMCAFLPEGRPWGQTNALLTVAYPHHSASRPAGERVNWTNKERAKKGIQKRESMKQDVRNKA